MVNPGLALAIRQASLTDGVIDRILHGRLIYTVQPRGKANFVFKLSQVILDTPRGPMPYLDEDLAELGIGLETPVRWGVLGPAAPATSGLLPEDLRLIVKTAV